MAHWIMPQRSNPETVVPVEIERKFLVVSDAWRATAEGERYSQGYLCVSKDATVRIRIAGARAFITV
ncbi:MAG: hypothetical protein B7Z45_08300, partial [Azorhizobium sp. 12-66-6]